MQLNRRLRIAVDLPEEIHSFFGALRDGIEAAAGDAVKVEPVVERLTRMGTAMVCVASDAPHSGRLTSVSVDSYSSAS